MPKLLNDERVKKQLNDLAYEYAKLQEAIAEGRFEDVWFQASCIGFEAKQLEVACQEANWD
jgi:hypothetical protein